MGNTVMIAKKEEINNCNSRIDCRPKIVDSINKYYNTNTDDLIESYTKINNIDELQLKLKKNKKELIKSIATHGAAQTNMKKVIYNTKTNNDKLNFYNNVSLLHIGPLIFILIGYGNVHFYKFKILNNFIINLVIIILYGIIIGFFIIYKNKNINRNQFTYNEHHIKFNPTGICNVKPTDNLENNKKEKEQADKKLNEFTT
jgi:hypothetical protein